MYFWRRATGSLSTHFAQLNEPLSSCLPPWEHFVKKKQNIPAHFFPLGPKGIFFWPGHRICASTSLPTTFTWHQYFCFYWKYLSQCSPKMHLFFSWLRRNPLLWFTIILRLNTAPQPLPLPFQHSALNIAYIRMHIECICYTYTAVCIFLFKKHICLPFVENCISICGKQHFIPFILSQPSRSSTFSWMISQTSSVRTMPLSIMASANFNFMSTLLRFVPKPFLKIKKYQVLRMRAEGLCLQPHLSQPSPCHHSQSQPLLTFQFPY